MKKSTTIVLIAITFFLEKSIAQFNSVWTANYQHTTTNNFSNESRKVVTDASGNSYILADVTSNIDPGGIQTTQTYHYTVLAKYSPAGALLTSISIKVYNHVISGFDNKGAFGLKIENNNAVYVGYLTYDPVKNFDVCLAKYNLSLNLQWERCYNPSSSDIGIDMTVAGNTAYAIVKSISGANTTYSIVAGSSTVTDDTELRSFAVNTEVLNAITDNGGVLYTTGYRLISGVKNVMTMKVNSIGNIKWANIFNGGQAAGDDYGNAITVSPNGFVYVAGTSDQGTPTENDVLILKLQGSGTNVWARYRDFNGPFDEGLFIESIDANYVYVGSNSYYNVLLDQVEANYGNTGGRIVYHPVPSAPYAALNGCSLTDFKVSPNYGFYLTGSTLAVDAQNRVFSASYLVKFVFADPVLKTAFKIDSEMPIIGDFSTSRSGTALAFNFFNNDAMWLEDAFATYGSHNIERVNLSDISMTSPIRSESNGNLTDLTNKNILITPNPSNSFISVRSNEKITRMELFDITGKSVRIINAASEMIETDLSGLKRGIYIGRIYLESGDITTRKIIRN